MGKAPTTLLRELQKPETSPCQHGELADSAMNSGARCVSQAHSAHRLVRRAGRRCARACRTR